MARGGKGWKYAGAEVCRHIGSPLPAPLKCFTQSRISPVPPQLDRGYAVKDGGSLQFSPTPLGQALISAYRKMGLANLWQPTLRGVIESNITAVAQGRRSKVWCGGGA